MLRFIPVLALLLFTACGLAENEQDDKNKRIYITFADPAFERFCLGMFDLDHDGRISRYEAQRVLAMDCSGRNISAMWEIGEFTISLVTDLDPQWVEGTGVTDTMTDMIACLIGALALIPSLTIFYKKNRADVIMGAVESFCELNLNGGK